ncbi:MAG: GAF domain-containing protein [Planctomycetota bacterium]|jgi:signal transduction histidine kinase
MTRRSGFWPRLSDWALSVPVRVKIMGIVLGVIFLLAIVATFQIRATMRATMREELRARGVSVARDVAGRATDLILTDNLFAVHELAGERVESDHDVRYVLIANSSQDLVAHTFGHSFPPELLRANSVGAGEESALALLDTEEGLVWDVAVPILEGRLGTVRVGMSERHLRAVVVDTTRFLLLVTGCISFVGLVAAYLLTFVLTKPILDLVKATEAIGGGDLQRKVPVRTRDEVGQLGAAFNAMTEALARSRGEIERSNRQLLRRNEELSVLNAIALTVSRSLDLGDVLDGALEKVLEAVKVRAGWVFLQDGKEEHLALAASKGLSDGFVREEAEKRLGSCVCREVMDSGEARIFDDLLACPRLSREVLEREGLRCHASIPLKAKERVLGIMNLACDGDQGFGKHDLQLLTSIGHQIGIAIENARLYEEVQHKEVSRRRLLDKLIDAQEEERKRVARELHDQVGQSLTALIMSLGSTEEMIPSGADEVKSQLAEICSFTAGILEEIRRLMMDLRPALLDDLGLIPAVRSFAETHLTRAQVQAHIDVAGVKRKLPSSVETTLFRVVQEAIMNTVKHADARKATIQMRFNESSIAATIEDDGKGFDRTEPDLDVSALGLLGMQERAEILGGNLRIDSQPRKGTRV